MNPRRQYDEGEGPRRQYDEGEGPRRPIRKDAPMAEHRTPAEVADDIAEAVRQLNYMTGAAGSVELEYPADLAAVVANLKVAGQRLPQLFGQMATWLGDQHAAGRVAHDRGRDATEYVDAVGEALQRATEDAETLTAALDSAHQAASGLKPVE